MSEEQAVVTAVPDTTQPVAVDPRFNNQSCLIGGIRRADDAALKHKLGLANSHTKAAEKRAKEAESGLDQLQRSYLTSEVPKPLPHKVSGRTGTIPSTLGRQSENGVCS